MWKQGIVILAAGLILATGCAGGPGKRSTGQVIDDTTLHAKAKAALLNDPSTRGSQIDIDVHKGVVVLNGAVDSPAVKKKAEDTIRGIEGVRALESKLLIRQ